MAKAKLISNVSSPHANLKFSSRGASSSPALRSPEAVTMSRSVEIGYRTKTQGETYSKVGYRSEVGPNRADTPGHQPLKLGTHIPYRPTKGLIAFFARTGTRRKNPTAPHLRSKSSCGHTYAEVVRSEMEGGGANWGRRAAANNGQGRGNSQPGRGNAQSGLLGRGGFQPRPIHPGYGGGQGYGYGNRDGYGNHYNITYRGGYGGRGQSARGGGRVGLNAAGSQGTYGVQASRVLSKWPVSSLRLNFRRKRRWHSSTQCRKMQ